MATDIVLTKKSSLFVDHGKKLGFEKIIFAQYYNTYLDFDKIDAVIIQPASKNELIRLKEKMKKEKKILIVETKDEKIARAALEKNVDILLVPFALNHVLCKIASKNNVVIAINMQEILHEQGKKRASFLTKIMQNIRLCRKYKTKIIIASFASSPEKIINKYDLRAFCLSLGMSTEQAKNAIIY